MEAGSADASADAAVRNELRLVDTQDMTVRLGSPVLRPDVVLIGETLYLGFGDVSSSTFSLARLRANATLELLEAPRQLFSGTHGAAVDIRVARADDTFWYAFEDFVPRARQSCGAHYLNAARYVAGSALVEDGRQTDLATGCTTVLPGAFDVNPADVPPSPEAVDDPTPFFWEGSYYILTRAWSGWIPEYTHNTVHHVRRLGPDFTLQESYTLDLSAAFDDRTLSQNALVAIDGTVHLVGGLYTDRRLDAPGSRSDIFAVPLTPDLHSVAGDPVALLEEDASWTYKTTTAIYEGGLLYIGYETTRPPEVEQSLAVFDPANGFRRIAGAPLHTSRLGEITGNHITFAVHGELVFAFYPVGGGVIEAKVFEWR